MHDTLLDTSATECPRCGSQVTDKDAFTLTYYDALFRCCSASCKTVWHSILIGRRNCQESAYGRLNSRN